MPALYCRTVLTVNKSNLHGILKLCRQMIANHRTSTCLPSWMCNNHGDNVSPAVSWALSLAHDHLATIALEGNIFKKEKRPCRLHAYFDCLFKFHYYLASS